MSEQLKWSPGPWSVDKFGSITSANGTEIAVASSRMPTERHANEDLIATAPELYAALNRAEFIIGQAIQIWRRKSLTDCPENWEEARFEARAALAKARGELA